MITEYQMPDPKTRYMQLKPKRDPYLQRFVEYAKSTLPYIMPEGALSESFDTVTDYTKQITVQFSTTGADNTNNLAELYMLTLFPPNRPFIRITYDGDMVVVASASGKTVGDIETQLRDTEEQVRKQFEKRGGRVAFHELYKHLIIGGNCAWVYPEVSKPNDPITLIPLDRYVVRRDHVGKWVEFIFRESTALLSLPYDMRMRVIAELRLPSNTDITTTNVNLYTQVYVPVNSEDTDTLHVVQSYESQIIESGSQIVTREACRWVPDVFHRVRNEDYGRGLIEDYFGGVHSLNILTEASTVAGVAYSDIKHLVKPGSALDVNRLNSAASGTYHMGEKDDVSVVDKGDARILDYLAKLIDSRERALARPFLSLLSMIRDAERVSGPFKTTLIR